MFCKNCGTKIPEGFRFCPNCSIKIMGEIPVQGDKVSQKSSTCYLALIGGLLILFVFLLAGIWIGRRPDKTTEKNRENSSYLFETDGNKERNASETTTEPTTLEKEPISLTGTWKCGEGEVTFTESGNMMLGIDGIVLGGGWVQYEVVDDKTLYVTGGGLPVGMNISYMLDGDYLNLEVNKTNITFTKK